ncbi:MAG TPA: arsenate reductase ArsC [Candidatus Polarisedimenticolia bacterium]|nr:arsenate reductase ArsC [Candidatus Polarisedimenticolia bacterium]
MPSVLFLCIENSCRSQMAEAYARQRAPEGWIIASAGSRPSGRVDETAAALMREEGIDLGSHRSKGLSDLPPVTWDAVVVMGCGEECPSLAARKRLEWDLSDPKGLPLDEFRRVRDEIGRRVSALLQALSAVPPGSS